MNDTKNSVMKNIPLTVLAFSLAFSAIISSYSYRYSSYHGNDVSTPTITVSGEGEASAPPDIATVTFTISRTSFQVKDAQKSVEDVMKKVSEGLTSFSINSKDVKTENYSVTPKYSYPQIVCVASPCPSSSPKLEGYEVSETVSVKIKNLEITGDVLALLGKNEVRDVSGPLFSIENSDALVTKARNEAVEKAKAKAVVTASALNVSLGDIRSYTEGGNPVYPMMYAKGAAMDSIGSQERVTLATGETKVKITVTLIYSLR